MDLKKFSNATDGAKSVKVTEVSGLNSVEDEPDSMRAKAFWLAFFALLSVASVSLRNTRSNSSLYPGQVLRDFAHCLHVGFVSSHWQISMSMAMSTGLGG